MLGGMILYWMYRGFDFQQVKQVLLHDMNWTWMLLSLTLPAQRGAAAQGCRRSGILADRACRATLRRAARRTGKRV